MCSYAGAAGIGLCIAREFVREGCASHCATSTAALCQRWKSARSVASHCELSEAAVSGFRRKRAITAPDLRSTRRIAGRLRAAKKFHGRLGLTSRQLVGHFSAHDSQFRTFFSERTARSSPVIGLQAAWLPTATPYAASKGRVDSRIVSRAGAEACAVQCICRVGGGRSIQCLRKRPRGGAGGVARRGTGENLAALI